MGKEGEGGGGRANPVRGKVLQGRYSKMQEGRLIGNRWSVSGDENGGDGRNKEGGRRTDGVEGSGRSAGMDVEETVEIEVDRNKEP
jgi:hypothetical protein